MTPDQLQDVLTRGPEVVIDRALAQREAQELHDGGEGQWGTDESAFLKVMSIRNIYQTRATFEEYARVGCLH